ncbi:hypothetical protein DOTSEDRAFT_29733 [Dothistroma septosporum NZE10]|uniref:RING-type domain-containing protein n=1 Tax=Dothistroma septosporum (strain NZE10 / CBS 128990) TaxID=675120 RepID=M2YHZ0_DOTSN|nr:hypothetical protein DOTSEDRAFT_29733 [Dothistroma septosporum NZE10]
MLAAVYEESIEDEAPHAPTNANTSDLKEQTRREAVVAQSRRELADRDAGPDHRDQQVTAVAEERISQQLERGEARLAMLQAQILQSKSEQAERRAMLVEFQARQQALTQAITTLAAALGMTVDLELLGISAQESAANLGRVGDMAQGLQSYTLKTTGLSAQYVLVIRNQLSAECSICKAGAPAQHDPVMTICYHVFCQECLLQWVANHWSCPRCRGRLQNVDVVHLELAVVVEQSAT